MKTISRYIMTLALLLTAVGGAWATDVYVVGNGTGNWLNDAVWDPGVAGNKMTEQNGVYSITFTNVAANSELLFKFAINGTWDENYGCISDTKNELNKTLSNIEAFGTNIMFGLTEPADVTISFNPSEMTYMISTKGMKVGDDAPSGPEVAWNASTKTGTFAMPGSDVVLTPIYAKAAAFATTGTEPEVKTLLPEAAEGVIAGTDASLIAEGTGIVAFAGTSTEVTQGTLMYAIGTSATEAPALTAFSATVPTAKDIADDGATLYVWYYIQGADTPDGETPTADNTFNDSEICTTPLTVTVRSNKFDLAFKAANDNTIEAGKATVTVGGTAATVTEGKLEGVKMGSEVKMTAKEGYKFRKVEVKKKAAGKPVSEITPDDIFKVIASDGIIYDNIAAAESAGTVAQGLIVYVGSNTENENYNHGLALALNDENSNTQGEAINACNAKNTSTPIVDALWMLPSKDQWNTMFNAAGSDWKLRDCFSSAGGNNMVKDGEYWSSSGDSEWVIYWMFSGHDWEGTWGDIQPYYNYSCNVRACIVF